MTFLALRVAAISTSIFPSPFATPGKFIISPRPIIPGQVSASATSSALSSAPGVSKPAADGTQEGTSTHMCTGCSAASSAINLTPFSPKTLAISCGSVNMPVVPCGRTARTNSLTVNMPDSTCICPSSRPGTRYLPPASMMRVCLPMVCAASGPT